MCCRKAAEQMGVGDKAKKGGWRERNINDGNYLIRKKKKKQLPGRNLCLGLTLSKEASGTGTWSSSSVARL